MIINKHILVITHSFLTKNTMLSIILFSWLSFDSNGQNLTIKDLKYLYRQPYSKIEPYLSEKGFDFYKKMSEPNYEQYSFMYKVSSFSPNGNLKSKWFFEIRYFENKNETVYQTIDREQYMSLRREAIALNMKFKESYVSEDVLYSRYYDGKTYALFATLTDVNSNNKRYIVKVGGGIKK